MHLYPPSLVRCAAASALLWLASGPALAAADLPLCPDAADTSHRTLLGHWDAQFSAPADQPAVGAARPSAARPIAARLELTPHPELSASVRGRLQRAGTEALLAGDVHEGDFTLEESINGTNISATWIGQVVPKSCGKEIRGTWTQETPPLSLSFVLRKQAGE